MASVVNSNKLSRELLRWIQSLDLAYSIKNVKRDFSNGFLVAEIVARYFDKDISMHSYDNGSAKKVKVDNWGQLLKFFKKIPGLEDICDQDLVNAIIHCENGAAVKFLNTLYEKLTRREVQEVHPATMDESVPPYAKPTGSALIRDKMNSSEILNATDETEIVRKMKELNELHEESLQMERTIDPERFSITDRSASRVVRGTTTKPIGSEQTAPVKVQVKEVQIRALNQSNLAHLRATRDNAASLSTTSVLRSEPNARNTTLSVDKTPRKRIMDVLDEYLKEKLSNNEMLRHFDHEKKAFQHFVEVSCCAGRFLSENEIVDIIDGLSEEADLLSDTCLEYPKDYWLYSGLLLNILTSQAEDSTTFMSTIQAFTSLGHQCVKRDPGVATQLFTDFTLPKVAHIITKHPGKRHGALSIMYAFCPTDIASHSLAIERLRDHISDVPTFIHALSILVYMENDMDAPMVDLYYYYCSIGMQSTSESLRAATIAMLVAFLPFNASLVLSTIPKLLTFSTRDAWWEVKVQLLIVCSAVLHDVNPPETDDQSKEALDVALDIIHREFSPRAPNNLRRLGLSYLAKNLHDYQELVPLFVDVLLSLSPEKRENLLTLSDDPEAIDEIPLLGTSGGKYQLISLPSSWDSLSIGRQVYLDHLSDSTVPHDIGPYQIICACFNQLAISKRDQIADLYLDLKDCLVQGLLKEESSPYAADILTCAAFYATTELNVLDLYQLDQACAMVASADHEDTRQISCCKMLREICMSNASNAASVRAFLEHMQSNEAGFKGSLFQTLLDEIYES